MTKARANITVYRSTRSTRFSGSSLILSCLTVSFSYGIVYSGVKTSPECEKKKTYVYVIKRKIKKKRLVYVPGTYLSPFALALEGGVNSNPSSRERLFLRTANPRQDQNNYVHGWHEACCRIQETRPSTFFSSFLQLQYPHVRRRRVVCRYSKKQVTHRQLVLRYRYCTLL